MESPFFEDILSSKNLSDEQRCLAKAYNKNGFVVISGLLPVEFIDKVRYDVETRGFDPGFPVKTFRNEIRIQDFWGICQSVRELAYYPAVLEILEFLYERPAVPFQTLNFSMGSQQKAHSDTVHFSSLPARYMCGVWVALEDVTEEKGPLFYYPGSQILPEYDFSHIRQSADPTDYSNYKEYEDFIERIVTEKKLEKKKLIAKKGDLLIWSSNIIHGGSPVTKPGVSRWSQVTHYFFEDCYYYTPMLSNMATRELHLRNNLIDIRTGKRMKLSYNGNELNIIPTGKTLFMLTYNKSPETSIVKARIKKEFYKAIGKKK